MSGSFVKLKGVGFWANDGLLQIWIAFLVQEVERLVRPPAWLAEVRAVWVEEATDHRSGTHDPYLDRFISSPERKTLVLRIAHAALDTIGRLDDGVEIAHEMLPRMEVGGDPHWAGRGLPSKHLLHVGAAFIALLLHVPIHPELSPGAVAIVLEQIAMAPTAYPVVTARARRGHLNIGVGRFLLPSGLAFKVTVERIQLFGSRTIGARSPSQLREMIVGLSGLAHDVVEPDALLVQQGGRV